MMAAVTGLILFLMAPLIVPAKTCLYKTICKRDLQLHPTRKHLRSGYKFLSDIQQMSGHSFQSLEEQKNTTPRCPTG